MNPLEGVPHEIREKYLKLVEAQTGDERCIREPELFTENWVNSYLKPEKARELCAACPLLELCKDYAVSAEEPYWVWGGTVPSERGWEKGVKPWRQGR